MSEPKRWRDDHESLDADERRLLRAGLREPVPRAAKRAVWTALAAQVPAATAAASTGAGTLTALSLLKSAGIGVALGVASAGGVTAVRHLARPPAPGVVAVASPGASHAPRAPVPSLVDSSPANMNVTPPALEPAAPSSSTPTDVTGRVPVTQVPQLGDPSPASQPHASTLPLAGKDSESLLVAAARSSLRGGRTREALALLERLRAEQPHGELAQEREALTIEALRALGQTQAARGRASVFLERYPRSPHAATVRRALE